MPAKYYALTKILPSGDILSIINIDTAILKPDEDDTTSLLEDPDWEQNRADHLKWIDETLEMHSKAATWVIVCGHYPIYSVGVNGDNSELLDILYPILQYHHVHMYVAGHDHNHQYIAMPDGITHVIAGNGAGRGPFGPEGYSFLGISESTNYIENYFTDSGFAHVEVDDETFSTTFVDAKGNVHYTGTMTNPHTAEYRSFLSRLENHNYHSSAQNQDKQGDDDSQEDVEFFDFVAIMLPGFVVIALLGLYVFQEEPRVASFLTTVTQIKNEAVHEINLLITQNDSISSASGARAEIRPEMDSSTRSNVGLTSDMDRSGRRQNSIDRSMHV